MSRFHQLRKTPTLRPSDANLDLATSVLEAWLRGGPTDFGGGSNCVTTVAARKSLVVSGAISGLRAWVAYWIVESVFWVLLPWSLTPSYEYRPAHPLFAVVALIAYITSGAVLGVLIGLSAWRRILRGSRKVTPTLGPLSLVLAFIILRPLTGKAFRRSWPFRFWGPGF